VAGEALSAGVNAVARNFAPQGTRATADALRETAEAAYQRADTAGVTFAPTDTQKVGDSIKQMLVKRGFHPVNEPGVMPVLDALDALSKKPTGVTLGELETVRRVASNGFRPGMASNNAALSEIAERLDDFVLSAQPLTGD